MDFRSDGWSIMKSPLQKISAEQARVKRQWGYFKAEMRRDIAALSERMAILESYFRQS